MGSLLSLGLLFPGVAAGLSVGRGNRGSFTSGDIGRGFTERIFTVDAIFNGWLVGGGDWMCSIFATANWGEEEGTLVPVVDLLLLTVVKGRGATPTLDMAVLGCCTMMWMSEESCCKLASVDGCGTCIGILYFSSLGVLISLGSGASSDPVSSSGGVTSFGWLRAGAATGSVFTSSGSFNSATFCFPPLLATTVSPTSFCLCSALSALFTLSASAALATPTSWRWDVDILCALGFGCSCCLAWFAVGDRTFTGAAAASSGAQK